MKWEWHKSLSLNHSCSEYIAGLNVLAQLCILSEVDWEITNSGVARPKWLISVFLARVNCKKIDALYIGDAVIFHVCLKPDATKIKTFTDYGSETARFKRLWKCLRLKRRERQTDTRSPAWNALWAAVTRPNWLSLTLLGQAELKPTRKALVGHSPLAFLFSAAIRVRRENLHLK